MIGNHRMRWVCQFAVVVVWALGLLYGCKCAGPVDSDVGTDSLYAYMILECKRDGTTHVQVELSVGGTLGSDIDLGSGDELVVTVDGRSQKLKRERTWLNQIFYTATLDTDDPGAEVTISFQRANYTSAPDSWVTLPDHIVLLSPQAGDTLSRDDEIVVSWEPFGGSQQIDIELVANCRGGAEDYQKAVSQSIDDLGNATWPVADLLDKPLDENEVCDVTITLKRQIAGTLAAEYKSGTIAARREATVSVQVTR